MALGHDVQSRIAVKNAHVRRNPCHRLLAAAAGISELFDGQLVVPTVRLVIALHTVGRSVANKRRIEAREGLGTQVTVHSARALDGLDAAPCDGDGLRQCGKLGGDGIDNSRGVVGKSFNSTSRLLFRIEH